MNHSSNKLLKTSVIIPTKDRPHDLARCLESVLGQTLRPNEIIVVDASSTDKLNSNIVTRLNEKVKTIYLHTAAGLTHQKNVGVQACSGDIVFFFDDDVVLEKDFIKVIIDIFDNDQERKVAGVCGKVLSPPGQENLSLVRSVLAPLHHALLKIIAIIFLLSKAGDGTFRASGFPNLPYVASEVKRVEFLSGGLTAWRREVLNEFKFDEKLPGPSILEDNDFSYRVSRKYVNIYTPYAKTLHNVSLAARINAAGRARLIIENRYYLFKKNLPQNLKHKLAFYWAVIGLFLQAIVNRDTESLKGLFAGLVNLIRHSNEFSTP